MFVRQFYQAIQQANDRVRGEAEDTLAQIKVLLEDKDNLREDPVSRERLFKLRTHLRLLNNFGFHLSGARKLRQEITETLDRIKTEAGDLPQPDRLETLAQAKNWLTRNGLTIGDPKFGDSLRELAPDPELANPVIDRKLALPSSKLGLNINFLTMHEHLPQTQEAAQGGLQKLSAGAQSILNKLRHTRSDSQRILDGHEFLGILINHPAYLARTRAFLVQEGIRSEDLDSAEEITRRHLQIKASTNQIESPIRHYPMTDMLENLRAGNVTMLKLYAKYLKYFLEAPTTPQP